MHTCPECGKKMATHGGLEIHMEMGHDPEPVAASAPVAAPTATAPATAPVAAPASAAIPGVGVERPRRTARTRTGSGLSAVPLIAFAIVALLVAGVATAVTRRNGPSALAMVHASASTTADAKTAQVSVTIKSDSGPLANGITVNGGFDFASRRARIEIDPSTFGAAGVGKIQAVADYSSGFVMYMRFPPQFTQRLGGKPWVKFDVDALARQAGLDVDFSSLVQGQSNDPTQGLGMVRGADNVVKVGTEQIRDVDTTHYQLSVDLDKALAEAPTPEQRAAVQKLADLYTIRTLPLDLWLDSQGRVARYQQTIDTGTIRLPASVQAQSNPLTGRLTVTYDLYDFGSPVDVKIPPPDQVTDLSTLLNQRR